MIELVRRRQYLIGLLHRRGGGEQRRPVIPGALDQPADQLDPLVAGFTAMLLNPVVANVQRRVTAGALQVLVKEVWQATAPDQPQ